MPYITLLTKRLVGLLLLVISLALLPIVKNSYAIESVETFDGSITQPSIWGFIRNLGLSFDSEQSRSFAKFDGFNTTTFPYLRSTDLSGFNITTIEFESRFTIDGILQGAGIILSDSLPAEELDANFGSYLFYIWPKPDGTFHLFTPICPVSNPSCNSVQQLINGVVALPNNSWNVYSFEYTGGHYLFYVDGIVAYETVDTPRSITYVAIGQPDIANFATWPEFDINYMSINAPVFAPTSDNPEFYYSQTDTQWGNEVYDSAESWAGVVEGTIARWGCALTDAAMVLKHYNVNDPVDNTEIDPGELNEWLIAQDDGYIGPGLVNWLAITRLVHESAQAGYSEKEFEFVKETSTPEIISAHVAETRMPIVNTGGHFVTIYDEVDEDNWKIADPLDENNSALLKNATLLSVNTYIPSSTDLTYIMVVGEPGSVLKLFDQNGNPVGQVFEEEPIVDEEGAGTSGLSVPVLYYPKPSSGTYFLGNSGRAEIFLYDEQAEIKFASFDAGASTINYNRGDSNLSQIGEESFEQMLMRLFYTGHITNQDKLNHMNVYYKVMQKFNNQKLVKIYELLRKNLIRYVNNQVGKGIDEYAKNEILNFLQ